MITRELDLVKFVQQRRMLLATALAILTMPQRRVAQNLSHMRIHESSDYLRDEDEDDDGDHLHNQQ